MSKWSHRAEHWETQALCYVILSFQVEASHPTAAAILWWYGLFCAAGAVIAIAVARRT